MDLNMLCRNSFPLVDRTFYANSTHHAIVTTLTSDAYSIAVAVLAHSVRKAGSTARLVLTYPEGSNRISRSALCVARVAGWELHPVELIPPPNGGQGMQHHRFREMYTKLQIWGLDKIDIDRVVYLDADTLVLKNFDELFTLPWSFGAVLDVYTSSRGFDVTFNAGVMVLKTSSMVLGEMREVMADLAEEARVGKASVPPNEAEQAFLNAYYASDVVRLPYAYNANLAIKVASPKMWDTMLVKKEVRVMHYTLVKPFVSASRANEDSAGKIKLKVVIDEQLKHIFEDAKRKEGGIFKDELTWWWDAYESLMMDKGHDIRQCLP